MAELTPAERLQPCLLDRLTDDHPEAAKESRDLRIVSLRRYRRAVLRDIDWLLNCPAQSPREGLEEFSEVPSSVLNFGTPDLCGQTASGLGVEEFERRLVEAVRRFEPRILPESLVVKIFASHGRMDRNALAFEIEGQLWAQPLPDPLYIRTEVDLETGQCEMKDRPNG
jgi:type VI secretion system protein ImpF